MVGNLAEGFGWGGENFGGSIGCTGGDFSKSLISGVGARGLGIVLEELS